MTVAVVVAMHRCLDLVVAFVLVVFVVVVVLAPVRATRPNQWE